MHTSCLCLSLFSVSVSVDHLALHIREQVRVCVGRSVLVASRLESTAASSEVYPPPSAHLYTRTWPVSQHWAALQREAAKSNTTAATTEPALKFKGTLHPVLLRLCAWVWSSSGTSPLRSTRHETASNAEAVSPLPARALPVSSRVDVAGCGAGAARGHDKGRQRSLSFLHVSAQGIAGGRPRKCA